jgi:hypothetical protein
VTSHADQVWACIAEHKARDAALQARDAELEDARYSEDTFGCAYPVPLQYDLSCGCVWRRDRPDRWINVCDAHEGL